ncbi:MAG TPA: hypothetical protein PLM56_17615 [Cyclobacteriaceae bacterium]|nr:hypothetical protein [Cyclobacteriaceae bacterium]
MNYLIRYIFCFLLLIIASVSYAQEVSNGKEISDAGIPALPDTLVLQKFNSVRNALDTALLKLSPTDKLDSIKLNHVSRLLSELDSLQRGLPSEGKLAAKMDSIKQASLQKIKEKLSFKERVNIPLNDQEKSFLQKHGLPLDKLNLSNRLDGIDIPKLPGSSNGNDLSSTLDKVKGNGDLTNKLPSIPTVQGIVPEQLKTAVDRANSVKEELGSVKDDIKEAKEKGLDYTEHADELAEESLKKLKEVKALEGQLSAAEKLKQAQQAELEKIKNAQHLRDQLASGKVTEKVLANEEQVKAYMEKMAKYKKKFDKLPDIRYVPKIKPNAMKGRPLKERFAPGMLFQIVKSDQTVSWYLAPEVLYKFSGTFSGGVAGVYRFQYNLSPKVIWDNPLYGYKVIGQAKTWKSFYLRSELERLNYFRPVGPHLDPSGRYWDTNWLVGVGRTQRISNRLNGYVWAFYNVTRDPSDIFSNKIIIKSGIQFNLVNDFKKVVKYVEEKVRWKSD